MFSQTFEKRIWKVEERKELAPFFDGITILINTYKFVLMKTNILFKVVYVEISLLWEHWG